MVELVDYKEFAELKELVLQMQEENEFLRGVILGVHWLTKPQVMSILDISDTTLWRLTKENKLKNYQEGSKTFYDIDSVRGYLTAKKISQRAADNRIIVACYSPFVKTSKT